MHAAQKTRIMLITLGKPGQISLFLKTVARIVLEHLEKNTAGAAAVNEHNNGTLITANLH